MRVTQWGSILCLLIFFQSSASAERLSVVPVYNQYALGQYVQYIEDEGGRLSIDSFLGNDNVQWEKSHRDEINLGYSVSRFWFKSKIESDFSQDWLLVLSYALLDDVEVFFVQDHKVIKSYKTGDAYLFEQRPIIHNQFIFPLSLLSGEHLNIYVSVKSTSSISVNLSLWQGDAFLAHNNRQIFLQGLLFGCLLLLSTYSLLMGRALRNRSYLLFSAFSFMLLLTTLHQQGYAYAYLFPNSIWWQRYGLHLSSATAASAMALFIIDYLSLKKLHLSWYYYFIALACLYMALGLGSLFIPPQIIIPLLIFSQFFVVLGTFLVSTYLAVKGHKLARYLLYSTVFIMAAFLFWAFSIFGVFEQLNLSLVFMQFAIIVMFLATSYALGDRLRVENEQHQNMKDSFMSTVTHELLTPINGIQLSLTLLKEQISVTGKQYWEMARNSNKDLLSLVESMIIFTEAQTGKLVIENECFNLHTVLEGIFQHFNQDRPEQVRFELEMAPDLPQFISCDKRKVQLILKQLLKNAFAFTKKGHVDLKVHMEHRGQQAYMVFMVKDNGFGIDNEIQEIIFDAFNQGDGSITREHGGLGIGLSNVRDVLKLLNGELDLNSQLSLGSEFIIKVPVTIEAQPSDNTQENARKSPSQIINCKVLVVEDNPVNMKLMTKLLENAGFKALSAEHGERALSVLRHEPDISAVLMDCQMPIMDGFEATREIRKMAGLEHLPIIAVTANVSADDKKRCFDAGMDDYLTKPASRDKIESTLAKWIPDL